MFGSGVSDLDLEMSLRLCKAGDVVEASEGVVDA